MTILESVNARPIAAALGANQNASDRAFSVARVAAFHQAILEIGRKPPGSRPCAHRDAPSLQLAEAPREARLHNWFTRQLAEANLSLACAGA